jgi:membrane-associated phospholipid phosphatase
MSVFDQWPQVLIRMGIVIGIILMMAWASSETERDRSPLRFYVIPLIPVYFKTVEFLTIPLYNSHNDDILIAADRVLCFGANPTVWLAQHIPIWPAFTECMMLSYSLFYFLPFSVGVEQFVRARRTNDAAMWQTVDDFFFIIIYAFLLSYLSYLIIPSVGPRFTLHDFFALPQEQPGLWLTEPIRDLLNRGENIMPGMSMREIYRVVTRDAFPSGHTDITVLSMLLAFRYRTRARWIVTVLGISLLFSTVYLRYHYVIDLIGGVALAAITLYTWRGVRALMNGLHNRLVTAQ